MFQKESGLAVWYRARTESAKGALRKTLIIALARKLLIDLWRLVTSGSVPGGVIMRAVRSASKFEGDNTVSHPMSIRGGGARRSTWCDAAGQIGPPSRSLAVPRPERGRMSASWARTKRPPHARLWREHAPVGERLHLGFASTQ